MSLATLFLLSLLGSNPPSSPLRVDLVFSGLRLPPRAEAFAVREAALVWHPYDVTIRAVGPPDAADDTAIRLTVALVDRPAPNISAKALGVINFVRDQPEPSIVLYPRRVAALVDDTVSGDSMTMRMSPIFREFLVGRALGRALAHEIGHYLLRSRAHSKHGLMRAQQFSSDLIAMDRHGFGLSDDEIIRLRSVQGPPLVVDSSGQ